MNDLSHTKNLTIQCSNGRTYGECLQDEIQSIQMIDGKFITTLSIRDKPKRMNRSDALLYYTQKLRKIWESQNLKMRLPMKMLIFIRHAKSSWSNPLLSDFERGLKNRGLHDVALMGEILAKRGIHPDLILSSPAQRAKMTAMTIALKLLYLQEAIIYKTTLYDSNIDSILQCIQEVSEDVNTLMLVGHNPELIEAVNALCETSIDNLPTCSVVVMKAPIKNWKSMRYSLAQLISIDIPGIIKNSG